METNFRTKICNSVAIFQLFLAVFSLMFYQSSAQTECFTPDNNTITSLTQPPSCTDYVLYEPDWQTNYQNTPILTFKINFHFFRHSDGSGLIQPGPALQADVDQVMQWLNGMWGNISPPTLPVTPPADEIDDTRIRFELKGTYIHDDDNYYSSTEICGPSYQNAWGVNTCNELNVFWYFAANPNGPYGGCGPYGYVNMIIGSANFANWATTQMLSHELGHSAGVLPHTCGDQFIDTYDPDCNWQWVMCNGTTVSNNIMGYNICRDYLSPMQMGWMHMYANSGFPNHNTTKFLTYCDYDPANSITINSSQTWITSKAVGGDITVTSGNILRIQCNVNMPFGGKIYVEPNAQLIIDGGKVTNACCSMWDGVYLDGPTAILTVQAGGIIEKAINAVYTTNGGVFQIENSTLQQNYNHIHLEGVTSAYPGYVRNSTLACTAPLPDPYPGTYTNNAVEIKNCSMVIFGDDASSGYTNFISGFTNYGISIISSDATVINNNISSTVGSNTIGVYGQNLSPDAKLIYVGTTAGGATANSPNSFHDLYRGVVISNKISPTIHKNYFNNIEYKAVFVELCHGVVSITENDVQNSPLIFIGVHAKVNYRATNILIDQNHFDLHPDATAIKVEETSVTDWPRLVITSNEILNVKRGIWVINEANPEIRNNYPIQFDGLPPTGLVGVGIFIQGCFQPKVESNRIISVSSQLPFRGIIVESSIRPYICGNHTERLERGIECSGVMLGTKVKLNTMIYCFNGFVLSNAGDIGEQGAATNNDVSDNMWIGNTWDTYAYNGSNNNPPWNTRFDVRNQNNYKITTAGASGSQKILGNIINSFNPADCADIAGWRKSEDLSLAATAFKVYPNPASDEINVEYDLETDARFELMDLTGRKVVSETLDKKSHHAIIDINSLKAGTYFYTVLTNDECVKKDKITIIK